MPARWKTGLALLAIFFAGQLRGAPLDAQAVIERCASQIGATATGISALSRSCPGIRTSLDQVGLTTFLPSSWTKTLTARGLDDVDALFRRYSRPPPSAAPSAATLRSIAGRLAPPLQPLTWWAKVRLWIRHWASPLLRPVRRWLRQWGPSRAHPGAAKAVLYALIGLLLLGAIALLTIELRRAGLVGRRRSVPRARRRPAVGPHLTDPVAADSGEPDWAQLREQPARVLRLLVDTLTRAHRLERDRHLTCRELERQARFDSEIERGGFARVARLAERQVYGPPGLTPLSEESLQEARVLHERLLAVAGKREGRRP